MTTTTTPEAEMTSQTIDRILSIIDEALESELPTLAEMPDHYPARAHQCRCGVRVGAGQWLCDPCTQAVNSGRRN